MLRLLLSSLLLFGLSACSEEDVFTPPPFPAKPTVANAVPAALASPFQVEPYLQLGAEPSSPDRLALRWQAQDGPSDWVVEVQPQSGEEWTRMAPPVSVLAQAPRPYRVWAAALTPLEPGLPFEYRVLLEGTEVFRAEGKALQAPGQPQEVVVAGDLTGKDWPLARQIHRENPDLMVAAGDLVPPPDTLPHYRQSLFSSYNAGRSDPKSGIPFMRSTVLVSALPRDPGPAGLLACRTYWDLPRAEPERFAGPIHGRSPEDRAPGLGNFCFRSGDSHWTVLDASGATPWNDPGLRRWLARNLAAARSARWRFVVFQPPSRPDPGGGALKALWPLFRKYQVAIVFAGPEPLVAETEPSPPARESDRFARLEITPSRVVCEQVDGRGTASGRITLSH